MAIFEIKLLHLYKKEIVFNGPPEPATNSFYCLQTLESALILKTCYLFCVCKFYLILTAIKANNFYRLDKFHANQRLRLVFLLSNRKLVTLT